MLNLSHNRLKIESVLCICEALVLNVSIASPLRKLDLSHNQIGPKGAKLIAESLKDNTCLRHLNISYNSIGNQGAKWIATLISEHCQNFQTEECLSELKLTGNDISLEGLIHLFYALTPKPRKPTKPSSPLPSLSTQHVHKLDLLHNALTSDTLKFLMKFLELNNTIQVLKVTMPLMSDKQVK